MMAEISTETPIWVALNMSKVLNKEESFELMDKVGPRVCITTATHPGFVGFMANLQTGVLPLAGRYGGGSIHMEKTLNPIRNYQYTMWKHWQDHDEFHAQQFDRIFELCTSCLEMVVEGPLEKYMMKALWLILSGDPISCFFNPRWKKLAGGPICNDEQ